MDMAMAVAVEVEAMPVEVAVPTVPVNMARVDVNVPAEVNVPAMAVHMTVQTGVVTDHAGITDHTVAAAMTADAVVTTAAVTAATVRTCIGAGRDESTQANNGRGNQSEKCSTFEHCQRPFWLVVNHPNHWSEFRANGFKRLIFAIFSFI
jgi:hypothetical protein